MIQKKRKFRITIADIIVVIIIFAIFGWTSFVSTRRTPPPDTLQSMEAALEFSYVNRIVLIYDDYFIEITKCTNPEQFMAEQFMVIQYAVNPIHRLAGGRWTIDLKDELMEIIFFIDDNRLLSANIFSIVHFYNYLEPERGFRDLSIMENAIWNNEALIIIDNNPMLLGSFENAELSKYEIIVMFLDYLTSSTLNLGT